MHGVDVTVNWKYVNFASDNQRFFTDSNAYRMVEREVDHYTKLFGIDTTQKAAANYYPIN